METFEEVIIKTFLYIGKNAMAVSIIDVPSNMWIGDEYICACVFGGARENVNGIPAIDISCVLVSKFTSSTGHA